MTGQSAKPGHRGETGHKERLIQLGFLAPRIIEAIVEKFRS
jgi:hypothetical protein